MVIFQYNLYIFGIHLWTVLYTKPFYNEPCYKEVMVYMNRNIHIAKSTLTCVTKENSDQPLHPHSLTSLSAWRKFTYLAIQNMPSEDSDQTLGMHRLIWIFAGHIYLKLHSLTLELISKLWPRLIKLMFSQEWTLTLILISLPLTLRMPRKPASENVICLCCLLNILANFSNLFLHTGKQCGPWSDCS